MTISTSLFAAGRSAATLTDAQADGLTTALSAMGLDPRDSNGASLSGMTSAELMSIGVALGNNSRAGDIIAASECDGTRIAIVDDSLQLMAA